MSLSNYTSNLAEKVKSGKCSRQDAVNLYKAEIQSFSIKEITNYLLSNFEQIIGNDSLDCPKCADKIVLTDWCEHCGRTPEPSLVPISEVTKAQDALKKFSTYAGVNIHSYTDLLNGIKYRPDPEQLKVLNRLALGLLATRNCIQ